MIGLGDKKKKKNKGPYRPGWIKQGVTDRDNVTYDGGRLALFYLVFGIVTLVILVMLFLSGWDVVVNKKEFHPNDLGIGVMGVLTGVGGVLLGLGGYLFGDKQSQPQQGVTYVVPPQQPQIQPSTKQKQQVPVSTDEEDPGPTINH